MGRIRFSSECIGRCILEQEGMSFGVLAALLAGHRLRVQARGPQSASARTHAHEPAFRSRRFPAANPNPNINSQRKWNLSQPPR